MTYCITSGYVRQLGKFSCIAHKFILPYNRFMHTKITDSVFNVGVNDHLTTLFESQYPIPQGISYNSYIIMDEKIAVLDTVDERFGDEWMLNVTQALGVRKPDFLIVHHMECDHSANIERFMLMFPQAKIVLSNAALNMTKQFFANDFSDRSVIIKEGSTLELGQHTLHFIAAPLVHWPEVMMSYDDKDKIFFSADAFGRFGANDTTASLAWKDEARRYYIGIVGKFGAQVQAVLKKAASLDIATICSLHGPVLTNALSEYINLYDTWSSYRPETDGVLVAYTSVYGHTKKAVDVLMQQLSGHLKKAEVVNLAECDLSQAVALAFKYSKVVFATTTYNGSIFPAMNDFVSRLLEHNFSNRTVGIIENGSWAPTAAKVLKEKLAEAKNLTILEPTVTIKSALNATSLGKLAELAQKL